MQYAGFARLHLQVELRQTVRQFLHEPLSVFFLVKAFSGTPVMTRVEPKIGFVGQPLEQLTGVWSARWSRKLTPTASGPSRFSLNTFGIAKVFINDRLVLDAYGRDRSPVIHGLVNLTAGPPATIRIEYVAT